MSPSKVVGLGALAVVAVLGVAACSSDDAAAPSSDRGTVVFADPPPGSTDLGLCAAYDVDEVKAELGGEDTFRRLAPAAIGVEGDDVTGEVCAWERTDADGGSVSLRIEVRDFGEDAEVLDDQFTVLQDGTLEAEAVEGIGDDAFSSVSEETSLLQVLDRSYLLTLSSRASEGLDPVALDSLIVLAEAGLEQLP